MPELVLKRPAAVGSEKMIVSAVGIFALALAGLVYAQAQNPDVRSIQTVNVFPEEITTTGWKNIETLSIQDLSEVSLYQEFNARNSAYLKDAVDEGTETVILPVVGDTESDVSDPAGGASSADDETVSDEQTDDAVGDTSSELETEDAVPSADEIPVTGTQTEVQNQDVDTTVDTGALTPNTPVEETDSEQIPADDALQPEDDVLLPNEGVEVDESADTEQSDPTAAAIPEPETEPAPQTEPAAVEQTSLRLITDAFSFAVASVKNFFPYVLSSTTTVQDGSIDDQMPQISESQGILDTLPTTTEETTTSTDLSSEITEAEVQSVDTACADCSRNSIMLSNFGLPIFDEHTTLDGAQLRLSFAAQQKDTADLAAQLLIRYSFDEGATWDSVGALSIDEERSNSINGGFFLFGLPEMNDPSMLDALQIEIMYEGDLEMLDGLFVDSVWLELFTVSASDQLPLFNEVFDSGFKEGFLSGDVLTLPDGTEITFDFTDDNTDETLLVKSSERKYEGLTQTTTFFSVTNTSDKEDSIALQTYLPEGVGEVISLEQFNQNKPTKVIVPQFRPYVYHCEAGWDSVVGAEGESLEEISKRLSPVKQPEAPAVEEESSAEVELDTTIEQSLIPEQQLQETEEIAPVLSETDTVEDVEETSTVPDDVPVIPAATQSVETTVENDEEIPDADVPATDEDTSIDDAPQPDPQPLMQASLVSDITEIIEEATDVVEEDIIENAYVCRTTNVVRSCDSIEGDNTACQVENVRVGETQAVRYSGGWEKRPFTVGEPEEKTGVVNFFKDLLGLSPEQKEVPEEFEVRKHTENTYAIAPGETLYFKMEVAFPPLSTGEYWIEAVGDKTYGLLDPFWASSWPYRMPLSIDNTQGSEDLTEQQVFLELDSSMTDFWSNVNADGSDVRFVQETPGNEFSWLDDDWTQRLPITITASAVDATLTDFPVYIDLSDMGSSFFSSVAANGADIRITTADGLTEVPYEIASLDTGAKTGELHFKAPVLSSSADTTFYLYFGNPDANAYTASSTYGSYNVWTNNYEAVYHLNDDGGVGVSAYLDSTNNQHHAQGGGGSVAAVPTPTSNAVLTRAQDFDGSGDFITNNLNATGLSINGASSKNISAWAYTEGYNDGGIFRVGSTGANSEDYSFRTLPSVNQWRVQHWGGADHDFAYASQNQWVHFALDYDGTTSRLYANGSLTSSEVTALNTTNNDLFGIGIWQATPFNGIIDEVRISTDSRSSQWHSAEHANQSNPSAFYATSSPESFSFTQYSELDYWLQHFDSSNQEADIWVQVDSLPAAASTTIYMYYGNPEALSTSDPYEPFTYSELTDLYYVVNHDATANIRVISLIDNNEVKLDGGTSVYLNKGEVTTFTTYSPTSVVSALGPLSSKILEDPAESLVPISFASTTHIFASVRGTEGFDVYAPFGDADVAIYDGSSGTPTLSYTVGESTVEQRIQNFSAASVIEADVPVLTYSFSSQGGGGDSAVLYPPTTRDLFGIRSNSAYTSATNNSTSVDVSCSGGSSATLTGVDRGEQQAVTTCATGAEGTGDAVRLYNQSSAIVALRQADGDGSEVSIFMPAMEFSDMYYLPADSAYISVVCSPRFGTTTIEIYNGDTLVTSGACTPSGENPGKAYFDGGTGGDTIAYPAGYRIQSDNSVPFYMYYEGIEVVAGGTETNIWGAPQARKFLSSEVAYSFGAQEASIDAKYNQLSYRWYENTDDVTPTDGWPLHEDTPAGEGEAIVDEAAVSTGDLLRLRVNLEASNATGTAESAYFKLQYTAAETCSLPSNEWTDVGQPDDTEAAFIGYDNPGVSDGAVLPTTLLDSSTILSTYEETNVSEANPNEITIGDIAEWDWAIEVGNAEYNTQYCFRMARSGDVPLASYSAYPELITGGPPAMPTLVQYFDNERTSDLTPVLEFVSSDTNSDDIEYQVQVSDDITFSTVAIDRNSGSHFLQFENTVDPGDKNPFSSGSRIRFTATASVSDGATYWYRVRGSDPDGAGEWGEWSEPYSFTTDSSATISEWYQTTGEQFSTNSLTSVSTSSGSVSVSGSSGQMISTPIRFSDAAVGNAWGELFWSDTETSGTVRYTIEYQDGGAWVEIPDSALSGNTSGFTTSPVDLIALDPTAYGQIRLRADFSGSSLSLQEWGVRWGQRVEIPTQSDPFNHEKVSTTTPVFTFTTTDPQADDIEYELSWSTDSSFTGAVTTKNSSIDAGFVNINNGADTNPFTSGDTVSFAVQDVDALANGTTYWWRTRAKDPSGGDSFSPWSVPEAFTVDTAVTVSTWHQTTAEQFEQGMLSGVSASSTNSVEISSAVGEYGTVAVTNGAWTAVATENLYTNPIVVTSVRYDRGSDNQRTSRVRNKESNSFEVLATNYDGSVGGTTIVDYLVMEAGDYVIEGGARVVAGTESSVIAVASNGLPSNPGGPTISISPSFTTAPVVLTSITSNNDSTWAVSGVYSGNNKNNPPAVDGFQVFLNRIFEPAIHDPEDIDYIALEPIHNTNNGAEFDAVNSVGDTITHTSEAVSFTSAFSSAPEVTLVQQTTNNGGNGAYAMVDTGTPPTTSAVTVALDEDGSGADRSHGSAEQVAVLAFADASGVLVPETVTDQTGVFVSSEIDFYEGHGPRFDNFYWNDTTPGASTVRYQVEYFDGSSWSLIPDEDWFNSSWGSRVPITIQSSAVEGALSDFPIYVDLSDLPSTFWNAVSVTGADIRITSADSDTEMPYELVSIDTGSQTGELHFKANAISDVTDTTFYIYFNNPFATAYAAGDTYGSENVWTNNFDVRYALDDNPSSSGLQFDSTLAGNNAVSRSGMTAGDVSAGKIGEAIDLDGNDGGLFQNPLIYADEYTASMWWNSSGDGFALSREAGSNEKFGPWSSPAGSIFARVLTAGSSDTSMSSPADGSWAHVVLTRDSSNKIDVYINGVPTRLFGDAAQSGNAQWDNFGGQTSQGFLGMLDELRFSDVKRSTQWIETEYNNQNVPSAFYQVGNIEEGTADTLIGNAAGFTSGPVDLSGLDISVYETIRLRATLECNGADCPTLDDWSLEWGEGAAMTGSLRESDLATNVSSGTIRVAVNGTLLPTTGTVSNGAWSVPNVTAFAGDVLTVYVEGAAAGREAVGVLKYAGAGNISGVELFEHHLSITSNNTLPVSNEDIALYDNTVAGTDDVFHNVDASNDLSVCAAAGCSGAHLYIGAGNTYQPSSLSLGNATTHSLINYGTLKLDGNTLKVFGAWSNFATTTMDTSTVVFAATIGTYSINDAASALSFHNLTFGDGVSTAAWLLQHNLTTTGALSVQQGTVNRVLSPDLVVQGNLSINTGADFIGSGTTTFSGATASLWSDSSASGVNMGNVVIDGTAKTVTVSGTVRATHLSIGADDTLNGGSNTTLNIAGNFINNNAFIPGTSEVVFIDDESGYQVAGPPATDWYDLSWSGRLPITINASQVDADLSNFPVLVDLADLGNDFWSKVQSNGADIRVTEADGETEVPREITSINTGTESGELHFRATSVSSSVNTVFYIYYGNSSATDYADSDVFGAHNVWSNGYRVVNHMNDLTTDVAENSTSLADGTKSSVNNPLGVSTGVLYGAQDFSGDSIQHGGAIIENENQYSVSMWFNPDNLVGSGDTATYGYTLYGVSPSGSPYQWLRAGGNPGISELTLCAYESSTSCNTTTGAGIATGNWHYVAVNAINAGATTVRVNGTQRLSYTNPGSGSVGANFTISDLRPGRNINFDGRIDEVRVSNVNRSNAWHDAEYRNFNNPSSFYTAGNGGTSFTTVTGTQTHTVSMGGSSFYGLAINDAVTSVNFSASEITVLDDFTIATGTVALPTTRLTVGGSFDNQGGVFMHNNAEVRFTSSGSETIALLGTEFLNAFYNVHFTGNGSWTFTEPNATTTNNFTIDNGDVTFPNGTLFVGGEFDVNGGGAFMHNDGETVFLQGSTGGSIAANGSAFNDVTIRDAISANWLDNGFQSRIPFTVKSSEVPSDVTDFPVYLDLADLGSYFFDHVAATGADIRITTSDEMTEVPYELQNIDTGAHTGGLFFKAPSLSSSSDTTFYIYFENGDATAYAENDVYGSENVWTNGYEAVYHLDNLSDSTGNDRDLTAIGTPTQSNSGYDFDGNTDFLQMPTNFGLFNGGSDFTVEMYINADAVAPSTDYLTSPVVISLGGENNAFFTFGDDMPGNTLGFRHEGWATPVSIASITTGTDYEIALSYDQGGTNLAMYRNGSVESTAGAFTAAAGTFESLIGGVTAADANRAFDGTIYDVRISSVPRSADWLALSYVNKTNPSSLFATSSLQSSTGRVFSDTNVTLEGSLVIEGGNISLPSGTLTVGGSFDNNGGFSHNDGTVLFNGTASSTIAVGASPLSTLVIDGASGDFTISEHATATVAVNLIDAGAFAVDSGITLVALEDFSSNLDDANTIWTGSTLALYKGGSLSINDKSSAGDTYGTLYIANDTHANMWNSGADTVITESGSSLYSQDHTGTDGELHIYGDYTRNTGTEYWSYSTDFDGTSLSGNQRQASVHIASSSSVVFNNASLNITGVSSASTTIQAQANAYELIASSTTITAEYFTFAGTDPSGIQLVASTTLTQFEHGLFTVAANSSAITIDGSTVDTNGGAQLENIVFVADPGTPYSATGGTVTQSDGYTYHTMTSNDTFEVLSGNKDVEVLVVGGGGGGAGSAGNAGRGGGGAGGVVYDSSFATAVGTYNVTVGTGGAGGASSGASGNQGNNSSFGTIVAIGGGFGGNLGVNGGNGGSGGGAGINNTGLTGGQELQTASVSGGYGNDGGAPGPYAVNAGGGGGGGAGSVGGTGTASGGGAGGTGIEFSQFAVVGGSPAGWFGGGGGASGGSTGGSAGTGGGGAGGTNTVPPASGTAGTGGGGGGSQGTGGNGGNGGSGIVIVRYQTVDALTGVHNVSLIGSASDYVWFRNGSGNLYGEDYDENDTNPGSLRWDDSSFQINISGTVYDDDGVAPLGAPVCDGSTENVRIVIDGGQYTDTTACNASTGAYSFSNVSYLGDANVVVYLDTNGGITGSVITKTPTADITDLDIRAQHVTTRHEDSAPLTIADMIAFDEDDDTDLQFIASTGIPHTLTVRPNTALAVASSTTFTPGGAITLQSGGTGETYDGTLHIGNSASFIAVGTEAHSVGGSLLLDTGASFTAASSSFAFTATTSGKGITSADASEIGFAELSFTGVNGGWNINSDISVSGDMLIATGTVTGTGDITLPYGDLTGDGLLSLGGGTVVLERTNTLGGLQDWTFNNLTLGNTTHVGTTTLASNAEITIGGTFRIRTAHFFDAGSSALDLAGTGTVFVEDGNFLEDTSTVRYSGMGATNILSTTYYNLDLNAKGSSPMYTTTGGGIAVLNDLSIGGESTTTAVLDTDITSLDVDSDVYIAPNGTFTVTGDNAEAFTVGGSWDNDGTFSSGSGKGGTVIFNGSGASTIDAGSSPFGNVVINGTGDFTITQSATTTGTFTLASTAGSFTQTSGTTLALGGDFINALGGAATTWTGSVLKLYGVANYEVNDKTLSDAYDTLVVESNTHVRMWNSDAQDIDVDIGGSLYSQDHAGVDGELYIFGNYQGNGGTDHWSYATDFDGTDLTGGNERQANVYFASVNATSTTQVEVFSESDTFTPPAGVNQVDVLVVGGGGGGGNSTNSIRGGGGGGAGGVIYSPGLAVEGEQIVTVGAGGASEANGGDSSFGTLVAKGGGRGGHGDNGASAGHAGGSGGGSSGVSSPVLAGGLGVVGQGHNGGTSSGGLNRGGGGGGGAGAVGSNGISNSFSVGGAGVVHTITGSAVTYGRGGNGGGGGGPLVGVTAATSTGNGGGGGYGFGAGGEGGSGVVIVSYELAPGVSLNNGELEILGAPAATTTIQALDDNTYGFSLAGTVGFDMQYAQVRDINATGISIAGTPSIVEISDTDLLVEIDSGSAMTVTGDAISANPAKNFERNYFQSDAGVTGATNVTAIGSALSSWRFTTHSGNISGEAFDVDPDGDPGYLVWDDSLAIITISGNVYEANGTTVSSACDGSTTNILLAVDGVQLPAASSTCNATTGAYSISGVSFSPNDTLTLYIDGESEKGTTVSSDPISSVSDMHIYENHVIVRHENADPLTIEKMSVWDSSDDADILFTATDGSPDELTLPSNTKLLVWSNKTFEPNGNVTVAGGGAGAAYDGTLEVLSSAAFIANGSESHTVGGSFIFGSGASFDAAQSTVTFTTAGSNRTVDVNDDHFHNVAFAGSGSWNVTGAALTLGGSYEQSSGDVTFPTGTTTVGSSFDVSGGTFDINESTIYFTSTNSGNDVRFSGNDVADLLFEGVGGAWYLRDTHATATSVAINAGSVTLPSGTFALAGDFINKGAVVHNTADIFMTNPDSADLQAGGSDLYSVSFTGGGVYTLLDSSVAILDDLNLLGGDLTLATGTLAIGGSFDASAGTFSHASGTVLFNASAPGVTIDPGQNEFYNLAISAPAGGLSLSSATTTRNFTLSSANSFTLEPGSTLYVGNVFTNSVGGTKTTWTDTAVILGGAQAYSINTRLQAGDVYEELTIGAGADIRMWHSNAATTTVDATASLYSQDHNATDGLLHVYGDLSIATTTEHWSYATDFDGTALAGASRRGVTVLIAPQATTTVTSGALNILGATAATTTIGAMDTGAYAFAVSGGTFNASYYQFSDINEHGLVFSGSPLVTNLDYGSFTLSGNGVNLITLNQSALNANPTKQFDFVSFNTGAYTTGVNVEFIGTSLNSWNFKDSYGALAGEAFDVDGADSCGSVRFDDSGCLITEQTHYRWRNDDGGIGVPSSEWYASDWTKRKRVRVQNEDAQTYGTTTVKVVVDYDSDMRTDFADLRFTNSDGLTLVDHWTERITVGDEAHVWVQVPQLPAEANTDLFMYYGSTTASSVSSADTLLALDDFEDSNISEYTGDTSLFGSRTTYVYGGSRGLDTAGFLTSRATDGIFRFDEPVAQGQKIRYMQYVNMATGSADESCTLFGVQSPGTTNQNYGVCLELFGSDRIVLAKNVESTDTYGSVAVLASAPVAYSTGWYEVEVNWQINDAIDVALYTEAGTLVATTSATDASYTSGGYGFTYWGQHGGWDSFTSREGVQTNPVVVLGSEQVSAGASWAAPLDTPITTAVAGDSARLRFAIENSGLQITGQQFQLEFAERGAAPTCEAVSTDDYVPVPPVASCGSSAVCMATSSHVTNNQSTSDLLFETNGTFANGRVVANAASKSSALTINQDHYTEIEYVLRSTEHVTGDGYCFRVTNNGASLDAYGIIAELSLQFDPSFGSVTLNGGSDIVLTPGATTTVSVSGEVTDINGYTDLNAATSTIYRSGAGAACTADNNNCYIASSQQCTFSACSGTSCTLTCSVDMYFHADATDDSPYEGEEWMAFMEVTDQGGGLDVGSAPGVELLSLRALEVSSAISYGALAPASTTGSYNPSTTVQNFGNVPIDIELEGTDLSDGASSVIPSSEQIFATSTFDYAGCTSCSSLSSTTPVALEVDLTKPTSSETPVTDDIYWGIAIPVGIASNPHYGTNIFYAVSDSL